MQNDFFSAKQHRRRSVMYASLIFFVFFSQLSQLEKGQGGGVNGGGVVTVPAPKRLKSGRRMHDCARSVHGRP